MACRPRRFGNSRRIAEKIFGTLRMVSRSSFEIPCARSVRAWTHIGFGGCAMGSCGCLQGVLELVSHVTHPATDPSGISEVADFRMIGVDPGHALARGARRRTTRLVMAGAAR
jgi:hypothetical protein